MENIKKTSLKPKLQKIFTPLKWWKIIEILALFLVRQMLKNIVSRKILENMKYTKEERLKIGKEIYTHKLNINKAAKKYGINNYTARDYMRSYRDENNLAPMSCRKASESPCSINTSCQYLTDMSKEELIEEVIKMKSEIKKLRETVSVINNQQTDETN